LLESSFHGVSKFYILLSSLRFTIAHLFPRESASESKSRLVHLKVWRVQNFDMTPKGASEENKALSSTPFAVWLLGSWPVTAQEPVLEMVKHRESQPSGTGPLSTCICSNVRAYTKPQTRSRDS